MKPIDWLTHSLRRASRWLTGAMCCLPLLAGAGDNPQINEALRRGTKLTEETKQRLATTIIPHVSLKDATVEDAIAILKKEMLSPDVEYPAAVYPVQFVVRRSYGFKPGTVTVELKETSAAKAIDKIADLAGMTAAVNLTLVTFWPKPEALEQAKAAAFEAAGFKPDGVTPIDVPPAQEAESRSSLSEMSHRLDAAFAWVRSATLRASLLALAIVGLQLLLGRLIPPRWRYALWTPLLLVLVLPTLPKVPFGLFPVASPAPTALVTSSSPTTEVSIAPVPATMTSATSQAPPVTLNPYAVVWLAGAAAVLVLGVISYRRNLRRIVGKQVAADKSLQQSIARAAREVRLSKCPRVVVSTGVDSPAVTGLIRPTLLLPADFTASFSETEIRLILIHELTHLKRHDLWVNWLCCLVQALHWFNPVLWFAFARMREDREAACDAQVLSLDGSDQRSAYGHTLLKLQASTVTPALHLGFVGIFERKAGLKARIRDISRHRRTHPALHAVSMGLIALLLVFGATEAQEPRQREQAAAEEKKAKDPRQVAIEKKLDAIVIPVVDFKDTSIEEALDFLRIRSVELDKDEPEATKKGINFVIRKARDGEAGPGRVASLQLQKATLRQVLTHLAEHTKTRMKVDAFAVTFVPATEADAPAAPDKPKADGKAMAAASKIMIPVVDFQNTTLEEAVDFLRLRADALAPDKKAPAITLGPKANKDAVIRSLQLRNVPLSEAIRYLAEATKQPWGADDDGLWIGRE